MQLPVKSKLNSFMTSVENGAIYWEFSDGFRIAMHNTVYNYADPITREMTFKNYIDSLICDKRSRFLTKIYYKSYDTYQSFSTATQYVWVDFLKVLQTSFVNQYLYAWTGRGVNSVDIKTIQSVKYIDSNYVEHTINDYDGTIDLQTNHAPVFGIPMKDTKYVNVVQYNIDNPTMTTITDQLMQDIKITMDANYGDLSNTLAWINGVFIEANSITPSDLHNIVIQKGKAFINPVLVGYKDGVGPLTPKTGVDANATFDPDPTREDYRWNFDIRLFKWRGVKVSNWIPPNSIDFDQYIHHNNHTSQDIAVDFIDALEFNEPVSENHILLLNGVIINRDDYSVNGNVITLHGIGRKVVELIDDAYHEFVNVATPITNLQLIKPIVESMLPTIDDFSLVKFSSVDSAKTITLHRSRNCYINHPYPAHVTFPEYNVGDLITIDGMFEKYTIPEHNVIKYPDTVYRALYNNKNWLRDSVVERIFFTVQ